MFPDYSLAQGAGAAKGLLEGLQAAFQTQNMMQEQALKKKLANAQTAEAFSKLAGVTGRQYAEDKFRELGLFPEEESRSSSSVNGMVNPNAAPQSNEPQAQQGGPSSQLQANNSSSPYGLPSYEKFKQDPMAYGEMGAKYYGPKLQHEIMMSDPAYRTDFQKKQTDLANANLEQFNKGAESFGKTKAEMGNANDAFGKAMRLTDDPSPKNYQAALLALVKLDMPGQAANMTSIEQMEQNPQVMQKWGDFIKMGRTGSPTETSIKDLQRVASNMYAGKYENFKNLQSDEARIARTRGVQNPNYIQMEGVDKYGKMAQQKLKDLGPYQPLTTSGLLADIFPQHFGAAKSIGSAIASAPGNIATKAKGLVGNLMGNTAGPATSNAQTIPASIDPKDRAMMQAEIKRNPKSAASQHFMQVLRMYK